MYSSICSFRCLKEISSMKVHVKSSGFKVVFLIKPLVSKLKWGHFFLWKDKVHKYDFNWRAVLNLISCVFCKNWFVAAYPGFMLLHMAIFLRYKVQTFCRIICLLHNCLNFATWSFLQFRTFELDNSLDCLLCHPNVEREQTFECVFETMFLFEIVYLWTDR